MKFNGTQWINDIYDDVCIVNINLSKKERAKQLNIAFEEIFGKPMTEYEETEWDRIEALNKARELV